MPINFTDIDGAECEGCDQTPSTNGQNTTTTTTTSNTATQPLVEPGSFKKVVDGIKSGDSNVVVGDAEVYQGKIQLWEAAEKKGEVPGGYSVASEIFEVGAYKILPNYVRNSEGKGVLSHYTASQDLKAADQAHKEVTRIDWIIAALDLEKFKEQVNNYHYQAWAAYGSGGSQLREWVLDMHTGKSWQGGYLKETWTSPTQYLGATTTFVGSYTRFSAYSQWQKTMPQYRGAAMTSGAWLPNGAIDVGPSGVMPNRIVTSLISSADEMGGIGTRVGNTTIGCCTEFHRANNLLSRYPQYSPKDLKFTPAARPKGGEIHKMCPVCEHMFGH